MISIRENYFLQTVIIIALGWLALRLSAVLTVVFIAFLITIVIHPFVLYLKKRHFPTAFAVIVPVLLFFGVVVAVGFFIVPPLISQSRAFINHLPHYLNKLPKSTIFEINYHSLQSFLQSQFGTIGNVLVVFTTSVARFFIGLITVIVIVIYWLGNYEETKTTIFSFLPESIRWRVRDIWVRIEAKISHWLRAQIVLSIIVGVMVGCGSWAIGLPFPVVLGLISAILEFVPTLGPIAATIPGAAIGFSLSIDIGLLAILMHIVVQQIENHILAPIIMGRTVNLHPIIIIFSLLSGTSLYGILGALLAIPVALCISAVVDSYRSYPTASTRGTA